MTYTLMQHQIDAINFVRHRRGSWLHMEMSTGKTLAMLEFIRTDQPGFYLVVSKKRPMRVWVDEMSKHDIQIPYLLLDKGSTIAKAAQVRALKPPQSPFIIITNYESVWRKQLLDALLRLQYQAIVADESHKIANYSSAQSKGMAKLAGRARRRIAMTGTPYPNGQMGAFGQMLFVDDRVFGKKFTAFRDRYAVTKPLPSNPFIKMILGDRNTDELQHKLKDYVYSVRTDDVIELPPARHIIRYVDFEKEAGKLYSELERDFFTKIDGHALSIDNVLVQSLRLQQATSGWLVADDGTTKQISSAKVDELIDLADSIGNLPFVVFATFTREIAAIRHALHNAGISNLEVSGQADDYYRWKAGKSQAIVVQLQAGAEGIDLTRARYGIYTSIGFNGGNYVQSLARLRRKGADLDHLITYYYLIMRDTIDEDVYDSNGDKIEFANKIMERGMSHSPTKR